MNKNTLLNIASSELQSFVLDGYRKFAEYHPGKNVWCIMLRHINGNRVLFTVASHSLTISKNGKVIKYVSVC